MRNVFPLLLCVFLLVPANSVHGAGAKSPITQVRTLSSALIRTMRAGRGLSAAQRYRKLEPVIEQVFALPFMTRLSVGPGWSGMPAPQQKALITAFSRYTIVSYVHNFSEYGGQSFVFDPKVITRGKDKIIQTSLASPGVVPASLLYRMRAIDGTWKVVDVYYDGVSQLALHRVQFATVIGSGGAPALITYLNGISGSLMK